MKISWIKEQNDNKNFTVAEKMGLSVYKLENPEEVDKLMEDLVKQDFHTIILSNQLAGFSEDIIKKYKNDKQINIIIGTRKE